MPAVAAAPEPACVSPLHPLTTNHRMGQPVQHAGPSHPDGRFRPVRRALQVRGRAAAGWPGGRHVQWRHANAHRSFTARRSAAPLAPRSPDSLNLVWRLSYGIGLIPIAFMLWWRIFKLKESKVWIRKRSSLKSLGE